MEMEHINENTIRVMIGSEDLAERGITFLDLLGNHHEIESFFYSILEEVDIEDEFKGSEAVTFQVLPKNDGLELFISKNLTPDDLNKVSEGDELESNELDQFIRQQILSSKSEQENEQQLERFRVFKLADFEAMIELSNYHFLDDVWSDLYVYHDDYYLQLYFDPEIFGEIAVGNTIAEVLEYAEETPISSEVLGEYGKRIMHRDAIEITREHFQ
ncbi:adaptor protein MecA [Enterococcus sp. CSURQ0835]|uniref:adaptor protein MecA n=1 Tax=Enterococcus sp. CSURQ0835 TaxID=2681394 RepID=UPI00135987F9|nr:adaptor protein MecA [Enterococcus sp. CSURQ0835]